MIRLPREIYVEPGSFFFYFLLFNASLFFFLMGFYLTQYFQKESEKTLLKKILEKLPFWLLVLSKKESSKVYEALQTWLDDTFPFFRYSPIVLNGYKKTAFIFQGPKKLFLFATAPKIVVAFFFFLDVLYFHFFSFFYKSLFLLTFSLLLKLWLFVLLKTAEKMYDYLLETRVDVTYFNNYEMMKVTLQEKAELVKGMTREESCNVYAKFLQVCTTIKYEVFQLEFFHKKYKNLENFLFSSFYAFGFLLWATSSYWLT
jgi:hypothetical protein